MVGVRLGRKVPCGPSLEGLDPIPVLVKWVPVLVTS